MRADVSAAEQLLWEAARSRKRVREWAPWLAQRALRPERALAIALHVARSRDPDVRDSALEVVLAIDAEAARPLLPALRRQLRDPADPATRAAAWTIGKLRDREAIPLLRELARELGPQHINAQAATLAIAYIEGGADAIVERLRAGGPEDKDMLAAASNVFGVVQTGNN